MTRPRRGRSRQPVGRRPVRRHVTGIGERAPLVGPAAARRPRRRWPWRLPRRLRCPGRRRRPAGAAGGVPGHGKLAGPVPPARALPPSNWRSASARRRYRWASCSQVKPMPPSTWMQSLALSTAASRARAAAAAAASAVLVRRLAGRAGRVPGQRGGASRARQQHAGAQVLDRLERADRAAELVPGRGVLGGGRAQQLGHGGGLDGSRAAARSRTAAVLQPGRGCSGPRRAAVSATSASGREKSAGVRGVSVDARVPGRDQEPEPRRRHGRAGREQQLGGAARRSPAAGAR